jgi:hypothetical protein
VLSSGHTGPNEALRVANLFLWEALKRGPQSVGVRYFLSLCIEKVVDNVGGALQSAANAAGQGA